MNVHNISALSAKRDSNLLRAQLSSLKEIYENSRGFDEPFRHGRLKMIAENEKQLASIQCPVEEFKKLFGPVLPEDLFGPGQQWPPKNPPDKPPGA
jgi:hypothetical protein